MLNWKETIKVLLKKFDYEIRRRSHYYVDAFADQKKLLKNRNVEVVLDLGANVGQSASIYRKLFPKATIYCFEPAEEAFNILLEKYSDSELVKTYKIAVSDVTGSKNFYINQASVTNSLLTVNSEKIDRYIDPLWTKNVTSLDVESIRLDDFFENEKIQGSTLLKMDIQGGELMALKGANSVLRRQAIDLIYTEIIFGNAYQGQGYFHDLSSLLIEYGYVIYGIYNLVRASNGSLYQGDAIFISSQLESQLEP